MIDLATAPAEGPPPFGSLRHATLLEEAKRELERVAPPPGKGQRFTLKNFHVGSTDPNRRVTVAQRLLLAIPFDRAAAVSGRDLEAATGILAQNMIAVLRGLTGAGIICREAQKREGSKRPVQCYWRPAPTDEGGNA